MKIYRVTFTKTRIHPAGTYTFLTPKKAKEFIRDLTPIERESITTITKKELQKEAELLEKEFWDESKRRFPYYEPDPKD